MMTQHVCYVYNKWELPIHFCVGIFLRYFHFISLYLCNTAASNSNKLEINNDNDEEKYDKLDNKHNISDDILFLCFEWL